MGKITLNLSDEVLDQLDYYANQLNMTTGEFIQGVLESAYNRGVREPIPEKDLQMWV